MFRLISVHSPRLMTLSLILLLLLTSCGNDPNTPSETEQPKATFFVSPLGNDSWSGKLAEPKGNQDGPFLTIQKAQEAVKSLLEETQNEDITVLIRAGTYYLDETLLFSLEDSGQGDFQVIYRNYPDESPIISGGAILSDWESYNENIYTTTVSYQFSALFENEKTSVLARHPNQDPDAINPGRNVYMKVAGLLEGSEYRGFYFDAATFPVLDNFIGLELRIWNGGNQGFQHWRSYLGPVTQISYEENTLLAELDGITPELFNALGPGTDFYIQDSLELLDHPGEFFLDGSTLYYWPHQLPIEEQIIVAPRLKSIIRIEGFETKRARNITFEGLDIRHSDREPYLWANSNSSAAVYIVNAEDIIIRGNRIHNIGGKGVLGIKDNIQNITVESNLIYNIGDTAVQFNGYNDSELNSNHKVLNNHIHHIGLITPHALGLFINMSSHNHVAHNLFHDIPNAAINISGANMLDTPESMGNVIEFNEFHTVTLDFQDMGIIYIGQAGPDNIIRNNYFHDSYIPFSWGGGIYMDEYATGTSVVNNLIENLQQKGGGYLVGLIEAGDIETLIQNNIMAFNNVEMGGVIWPREYCPQGGGCSIAAETPPNDIDVLGNIFYNNKGPLYYLQFGHEGSWLRVADKNLFFNDRDMYRVYGIPSIDTLEEWKNIPDMNYDQNSLMSDPIFINPEMSDYRLRFDSPAYSLGFEDINFAEIGLRLDFPFSSTDNNVKRIFITSEIGGDGANIELSSGQEVQLSITARSASGYVVSPEDYQVTCSSNNGSVATVDDTGLIIAKGSGTTTIECTLSQPGASQTIPVYVLVDISPEQASLQLPPALSSPDITPFLSTLTENDFEGDPGMFKSNPSHNDWVVAEESGDHIYCGYSDESYIDSAFGSVEWGNYQLETWVRLMGVREINGGLRTRNSVNRLWGSYAHTINTGGGFSGVSQSYCGTDQCDTWQSVNSTINPGEWYLLRAEVDGKNIRTYLNGRLMINQTLDIKEYGTAGIGASPGTTICVDDIKVRSLDRTQEAMALVDRGKLLSTNNLLASPDSAAKVLGSVIQGAEVFIAEQTADQLWSYIRHDISGLQGWVLSENLEIFISESEISSQTDTSEATETPFPTEENDIADNPAVAGDWQSTDNDGSRQTLSILDLSVGQFSATYVDYGASLCGVTEDGIPEYAVRLEGIGQLDGNLLQFPELKVTCLGDPEWTLNPLSFQVTYDPGADSLRDGWGITWSRQP